MAEFRLSEIHIRHLRLHEWLMDEYAHRYYLQGVRGQAEFHASLPIHGKPTAVGPAHWMTMLPIRFQGHIYLRNLIFHEINVPLELIPEGQFYHATRLFMKKNGRRIDLLGVKFYIDVLPKGIYRF